jgi:hypothetical protein
LVFQTVFLPVIPARKKKKKKKKDNGDFDECTAVDGTAISREIRSFW